MYQILQRVRESQNAKICLLLGFCFITTTIFLSIQRSGDQPEVKEAKLLRHPSTLEMSAEEETRPEKMMTGGLGRVYEKDDEVVEVVKTVKPILEERSSKKFESLEVIHYRPQTVAGKNYFVKAKAKEVGGDEQIVHLRIYRDLKREISLTAYQFDKKLEDTLEYFQ